MTSRRDTISDRINIAVAIKLRTNGTDLSPELKYSTLRERYANENAAREAELPR
ncbi:MAG TPA: hypothetical protein V6C91_01285 [Coleofasciculaceae cyanobacterium]